MWNKNNCSIVWTLALPFFGIGMKTDLFQSCGRYWVFQICWHIECSTFTALSFRIWNSSAEIPSPSQALFLVMLPKAHLTSYSRMSGYRWVITPSWLSGSWRSFLCSSSYSSFKFSSKINSSVQHPWIYSPASSHTRAHECTCVFMCTQAEWGVVKSGVPPTYFCSPLPIAL